MSGRFECVVAAARTVRADAAASRGVRPHDPPRPRDDSVRSDRAPDRARRSARVDRGGRGDRDARADTDDRPPNAGPRRWAGVFAAAVPVGLLAATGVRLAATLDRVAVEREATAAVVAGARLLRWLSLGVGAAAAVAVGWLALVAAATVLARRGA